MNQFDYRVVVAWGEGNLIKRGTAAQMQTIQRLLTDALLTFTVDPRDPRS